MPVTILVTSDPWSNNGKIPEICEAAREHIKTLALELVGAENSTPETVEAGLRKAVRAWSTKQVVESMVVKDLTVSSFSNNPEEAIWGTQDQNKNIYTKKGILYVSEPSYGSSYNYGRSYYGRMLHEEDFDDDYPLITSYGNKQHNSTAAVQGRHANYDDMTEEEIFELFYTHGDVSTLM